MFSRDEMQRAIEDALKQMEGVALELYRRGREPLLEELETVKRERDEARAEVDAAYLERNQLVALLSKVFPAGLKRTEIPGWSPEWHGCVFVDFPWGQASWHYHERDVALFAHLGPYTGKWDGHTTEEKYKAIAAAQVASYADLRAEVERMRAEADRWKRSCNVFRERDWPKAFQATVTSLEQEVSDAHEQLATLHKLSKPWEGNAYRRGAEAMREACARWFREHDESFELTVDACHDVIADMPIPEEP